MAIFALHPTWGEFPYVPFPTTMTNWANSIAAGDTDLAKPCAYRAWLVTWRGFANIYSSTTIAISTTPVDQINHLNLLHCRITILAHLASYLLGSSLPIISLAKSMEIERRYGLATPRTFCQLTGIGSTEIGENSSRVHGGFTEGSLR
jgi:hypothetical protein